MTFAFKARGAPPAMNDRVALLLTSDAGRTPSAADLDEARNLTKASLRWTPASPALWTRLAYVETLLGKGRLGGEAMSALKRSYVLSPIDPGIGAWRVNFLFSHWSQADPDLRRLARIEATAIYARGWAADAPPPWAFISDEAGRFALRLALDRPVLSPAKVSRDL